MGRPPKSGVQVKFIDLGCLTQAWDKGRKVVATSEWHEEKLFPSIGFIVSISKLPTVKVVKIYNGPRNVENRTRGGKDTVRQFHLMSEEFKQSIAWGIRDLIKLGAKVAYHGSTWHVRLA